MQSYTFVLIWHIIIDNKIRMRFLTFVVDKSVRIYRW